MANILENDLTAVIGKQSFLCRIYWRNGVITTDEPESLGGRDLGPDPYSLLLASLASCTLSTLRMYIDRKGWDISEINIALNLEPRQTPEAETVIVKTIAFPPQVTAEQLEKLHLIAEKCPISKLLQGKITIKTAL